MCMLFVVDGGALLAQVYNREEIPADMLVVGVHERYRPNCGGVCYVETKSLDGERFKLLHTSHISSRPTYLVSIIY